jgi:hypothetical protein
LFHNLDDLILDNICDRVKPLVFSKDEKVKLELYLYHFTKLSNTTENHFIFLPFHDTDNQRRRPSAKDGVHCSWAYKE